MLTEVNRQSKFMNDYRDQQAVEKQVAAAVTRVILPRLNDDQRSGIVKSYQSLREAQANHRSMVDDIVNELVRRGY